MTASVRLTQWDTRGELADRIHASVSSIHSEDSVDSLVIEPDDSGSDGEIDWSHAAFLDTEIHRVSCETLELSEAHFTACGFAGVSAAVVTAHGVGVEGAGVESCRFGAVKAFESTLRNVEFVGCKIDYLNLRAAKLRDVRFRDCVIGEFDGVGADLVRLDFPGTRIGGLSLQSSHLKDVDVRSAQLRGIKDVSGLSGVTMSPEQAGQLAEAFARHLGIRIEEFTEI